MTGPTEAQTPRELVELWSATAAERLRADRATPGQLSGTDLNRLGELLISAATWLTADAKATQAQAHQERIAALTRTPAYAAMSFSEQITARAAV